MNNFSFVSFMFCLLILALCADESNRAEKQYLLKLEAKDAQIKLLANEVCKKIVVLKSRGECLDIYTNWSKSNGLYRRLQEVSR